MCRTCDSLAPTCGWVQAPDRNQFFMCGLCSPSAEETEVEDLEEVLEELSGHRRTAEAGTQTGLGLPDAEAAPARAAPRKRALEPGTTRPSPEIRAARVFPCVLVDDFMVKIENAVFASKRTPT